MLADLVATTPVDRREVLRDQRRIPRRASCRSATSRTEAHGTDDDVERSGEPSLGGSLSKCHLHAAEPRRRRAIVVVMAFIVFLVLLLVVLARVSVMADEWSVRASHDDTRRVGIDFALLCLTFVLVGLGVAVFL